LYALGIRHVGEGGARALARAFRSVAALQAAPLEQLEAVQDVGPVVARSVRTFLDEPRNADLLTRLGSAGVRLEDEVKEGDDSAGPPVLAGHTYVITGTLESMSREDAAEALERLGAKVTSSISRKTTGIIVGKDPGSKLEKARTSGVPELDEDKLLALIMKKRP
jgi:DNA ligase (NAD+)